MFVDLIRSLNQAHLLSSSDEKLLSELQLSSIEQIVTILNRQEDKQAIVSLAHMIGVSVFVTHGVNWNSTIQPFVRLLSSSDWEIRQYTAETLGRLKAYDSLNVLAVMGASDENPYVRLAAVNAIASWNLPAVVSLLAPIANDNNQPLSVREAAIEALGVSGSSEAIPVLAKLLQEKDASIVYTSIVSMNNTQNPLAIDYLETLLADERRTKYGTTIAQESQQVIRYLNSK